MAETWMVPYILRVGAVGFIIYVTCLANPGSSLFSYHPFFMTAVFTGLMTEAVFMFSKSGLAAGRLHTTRVTAHWVLLSVAAVAHGLGFAAIYVNKEINNKAHFTSWHGRLGLAASVLLWAQLSAGVFAKYPGLLKNIMKIKTVKASHGLFGTATFVVGMMAMMLGLLSTWFQNNNTSVVVLCCALGLHIVLMLLVGRKFVQKYGLPVPLPKLFV